ncbi:MAG: serine/threonine protein kinase [Acidobacteria bacterium]|nr:serine/threonine protein kinase [Acidobacteriota bacterium]
MRFDGLTPDRWKRIRAVTSLVLDDPSNREAVLDRECQDDAELREAVLHLARSYSETGDLFGCQPMQIAAAAEAGFATADRIGPYRILRELGRGGMGAVYLATRDDGAYSKQVAVKVLPYGGRDQQRLFLRERQILAVLEHPNLTRLLDGGTAEGGTPYLVMDYVDGIPIADYAAGRPKQEVLRLFLQACEAIRYAHQNLVVHCDLKPANILVDGAGVVKVLDFGIARLMEASGVHTMLTSAAMTPAYASPEQRAGRPVNTLSDVYSLGLVLYHLLAGRLPFDEANEPGELVAPSRWRRDLRGDLDSIVMKATETEPARRYVSVEQFARDIQRHLDSKPVSARQGEWWYRGVRYVQRRRWRVAAVAAFAVVMGLGAAGTLSERAKAERRFNEVRRLAQSVVFQYQDDLSVLAGSTALRARMATDAVRYLDRIATDSGEDEELALETALAYRKVGEVQGYGRVASLGDLTGAEQSLAKSAAILERLSERHPGDSRMTLEWATSLERRANVLSLEGRNAHAKENAERARGLLGKAETAGAARELASVWRELSIIEERRGLNLQAIEAARQAVDWARRAAVPREETAWAYERMATAIAAGIGPNAEAFAAANAALGLYGNHGAACAGDPPCSVGYLTAVVQLATIHGFAGQDAEVLRMFREREADIRELVRRDPNDRSLLRQLRAAQHLQGQAAQSLDQIPEALAKFRETIETAQEIERADPSHPDSHCHVVLARAKYAEVLVMTTNRIDEAESQLRAALQLADSSESDSLTCLDYRKVTVINLARTAERRGDWAAGMEWRRETVRNAMRYAAKSPGEPLGLVIEAGANYELGLGGLEASRHGDRLARLKEARQALLRALEVYRRLHEMGDPLRNQYPGWPQRTSALLATVERALSNL